MRRRLSASVVKRHGPHFILHIALMVALIVVAVSAPLSFVDLTHQAQAPKVPARVVDSHVCDKHDFAQGCALPPATVGEIMRGVDPTVQGVDFGWSCPLSSAQGFGASYLSYDTSKDWTRSCVDAFHGAGRATVAVWEAGASDATGGYGLGYSQAKQAASELAGLGAPAGQPFDMAIDCDCSGASLVGYFQGANAAEPGRINAYGGYYQIAYLHNAHLVGNLNWQTYAWSGGLWLPASVAPLEQYLNSQSVDYDRAIAANYGQWPYGSPKPPKPRTVCWGKGSTPGSSACKTIEAQANHDWQQYQAFHKGLVSHQSQASKVRGVIFSLQKNKASVYQTYKGPGLGWYAAREKPEVYYGNLNKARHDALVKAHHA